MLASRMFLLALVAVASLLGANAQPFCGGAGYDVSAAARDLSLVSGQWTYWVHPCGAVTSDLRCTLPEEAPHGAMYCQRRNTNNDTFVLSNYNETVARTQAKWYANGNGVTMEVSNGERCAAIGNYWRTSAIVFRCNPAATTPVFVSATEPETCWYQATIDTSSACSTIGATMSNVVGSSFYSHTCGAGMYDFSSLRDADMHYDGPGFDYWLRMCAFVTAPQCAAVQPTSFCQKSDSATSTPVDLSDWNITNPQLYTITQYGVDVMVREGDMCGNRPRRATYSLVCNPRARTPHISYVSEYQTCHYKAIIQTNAVCTGTNDPARGYCGGAGYDLSGLQGIDLTWVSSEYEWILHPCGIISPWYSSQCIDRESMFCQARGDRTAAWSLATWNRNVSRTSTWIAVSNGVQLYVPNSGESCGGVIRDTTVNFVCNRSAIVPWFEKVEEPAMCWYVATVHTEFACDTVGATAEMTPGSTFWSDQCGGGYWDVSDIRDEAGDLTYDPNPTTPTSGYKFYVELCGTVNHPSCDSVQPTMFCQVDKNTSFPWSLSAYREGTVEKYTINENGFTITLQNGAPCGGLGNRTTQIQVVCDNSQPAYVSSVREIETCNYQAVVHGRCRRGSTEPWSSTGRSSTGRTGGANPSSSSSNGQQPSSSSGNNGGSQPSSSTGDFGADPESSSSKLGGGAIAGIVIGSVVGALCLLAVLFFFCCAGGMSSKSKGTSRFDDASTQHSEMEMGSA